MKYISFLAGAVLALASCEKEIQVDLNSADPQLVIEGAITDKPGPYTVRVSETVNFSAPGVYPGIGGAIVVVSDNTGVVDTLTDEGNGYYKTTKVAGRPGGSYQLDVSVRGRHLTAQTTMPARVNLDSLRFSRFNSPDGSEAYITVPVYTDPLAPGNSYRFVLSVNGKRGSSYLVFNDNVTNGTVNQRPVFDNGLEITSGTDVTLEMRCIDGASYAYYYTLSQIAGGGPGGGVTPTNPPGNITGGKALGIFEAYTTQTLTAQVP